MTSLSAEILRILKRAETQNGVGVGIYLIVSKIQAGKQLQQDVAALKTDLTGVRTKSEGLGAKNEPAGMVPICFGTSRVSATTPLAGSGVAWLMPSRIAWMALFGQMRAGFNFLG